MARYTESRELVQAIGREVLAEGRAVTNAEVAAKIFERTGRRVSPNLVSEELQRFWALIGTELAQRHHVPELPASLAGAAQAFWNQAVAEADARWGDEKSAMQIECDKAQATAKQLQAQLDTIQAQYREAETLLGTERAVRIRLEAERAGLLEQQMMLEQASAALETRVQAAAQQLDSVRQAQAWQQQAHSQELQAVNARLAQMEETATLRAAATRAAEAAQQSLVVELDATRAALAQERVATAAERSRADRLALQVQMLEREDRAGRRVRQGLRRRGVAGK